MNECNYHEAVSLMIEKLKELLFNEPSPRPSSKMAEESSSPLPFFLYPHSALPSPFFPLALSDQKEAEKWSRRFPEGDTPRRPGAFAGQKSASDARRRQRSHPSISITPTVVLRLANVDNVLRHRELRK